MRRQPIASRLTPGQALVLLSSVLVAGGLGFLPLFGGPGYESALALGLLLPLPVAGISALTAHRARGGRLGTSRAPFDVLSASIRFALALLGAHFVVLLLHGARAGFCDPLSGLLLFALGPASGVVLAAAWGTVVGLGVGHFARLGPAFAVALAALGPIAGVLASLWRFWSSPMVFAFDPFVGYFAGTLYDTVIDAVPRLLTYRAGSIATLLAIVCACVVLQRSEAGRLSLQGWRRRPGSVLLGIGGAIASVGLAARGPALGHYQTTATIREALGELASSARCDIVYASGILPDRIKLLGEECDAHIESHEQFFETRLDGRVTVFAFLSARQKGELMGAAHTYIAKPWRREVYVQTENYPHPVLSHELAHVVSGTFAPGPFDVAGPLGGWMPDPGRIEGFAVAAAPAADSDYTLLEWTKALSDLSLLPPLQGLFRLSFFGQNSATGYTVAGAVVQWLRDRHGPGALRAWYAGATVEAAFGGETLAILERAFREDLDRVELPTRIAELAKARFDRPAIFGRRCPHVVDRVLQDATSALEQFDVQSAVERYEQGLELDPGNFTARMGLAACAQRRGDEARSVSRYQALASDESLTLVQRAVAAERLGDRALLAGDDDAASELYTQAAQYAFDEHRARTIDVKRHAFRGDQGREAIIALLIGDPRLGPDLFQASGMLGEWSARREDLGLADYLLGKNLYSRGRWREAAAYLERALGRDIPLSSVRREALRVSIFARCATGDRAGAEIPLREYLADPGLSSARKDGMQRFAESCRISQTQ